MCKNTRTQVLLLLLGKYMQSLQLWTLAAPFISRLLYPFHLFIFDFPKQQWAELMTDRFINDRDLFFLVLFSFSALVLSSWTGAKAFFVRSIHRYPTNWRNTCLTAAVVKIMNVSSFRLHNKHIANVLLLLLFLKKIDLNCKIYTYCLTPEFILNVPRTHFSFCHRNA